MAAAGPVPRPGVAAGGPDAAPAWAWAWASAWEGVVVRPSGASGARAPGRDRTTTAGRAASPAGPAGLRVGAPDAGSSRRGRWDCHTPGSSNIYRGRLYGNSDRRNPDSSNRPPARSIPNPSPDRGDAPGDARRPAPVSRRPSRGPGSSRLRPEQRRRSRSPRSSIKALLGSRPRKHRALAGCRLLPRASAQTDSGAAATSPLGLAPGLESEIRVRDRPIDSPGRARG